MNLIREAAHQLGWSVNLGECARIWKGGCIIRAKFLDRCVCLVPVTEAAFLPRRTIGCELVPDVRLSCFGSQNHEGV